MFNKCLFHLCDCTCSNVLCVCSIICGSNQKIFYHFICIWKCFLSLFVFKFCTYFVFQCFKLVFVLKNKGQNLSRVIRNLAESREAEKCIFGIFGHQAMGFASSSQVTPELATREMPKSAIFWVLREFLVQNSSYDSIMTPSSPNPLRLCFWEFHVRSWDFLK